jgi:hypothetical protein
MKNAFFSCIAILILFFGFQVSLYAQKTATWKGGTPGRACDWECATNWKEGRVPDEFSNVIIPDVSTSTFSYPVLENDVEILSLSCLAPARLLVRNNAQIMVLQTSTNEPILTNDSFAQLGIRLDTVEKIRR